MKFANSRVIYSLLFSILTIILVVVSRPVSMFYPDGNIIPFGVGENTTVFSFGVFSLVLAIVSFYIFSVIDLIFG